MLRKLAAHLLTVLSLAALGPAAGAVLATPAQAAPLGGVRLSATTGTVDATPVFAAATASAPCPRGFGRNAQLRVGPPGGPYSNLARPLVGGGYDRQPVTARPNRSFAIALGGAPVDGEWWVVVECVSDTQGVHPDRFVTPITVSGRQWRAGRPAGAPAATARSTNGPLVVPGSTGAAGAPPVGPAPATTGPGPTASGVGATGGPSVPAAAAAAGPEPSAAAPRLAGNSGVGVASLANVWWIVAVLGALALVGATWLTTRRSPGAPRGPRR
ncbi:hypothetical protein K7640_08835 [Micromonospora sp. PLK6-60]|uniref:hypothetical protein n=1 Tax=Micromonospora sp. PLK6-60 TaxID=2873383 RepID=UPI001CA6465D|nr:hypothetical protein [Micromonospora sp. PLK6-60]MBY8871945.1 hypothetical protein [Micromonospora sp. PLK6-60]